MEILPDRLRPLGLWLALVAGGLAGALVQDACALPGTGAPAGEETMVEGTFPRLVSAEGVRMTFFCSRSGERWAGIGAERVRPARRRVGFLTVAAPGYEVHQPRLVFHSLACSREDWMQLLAALRDLRSMPVRGEMEAVFPPEEGIVEARLSAARDSSAVFLVRQSNAGDAGDGLWFSILLDHDGERVRWRPLPDRTLNPAISP
jgi:hypothetical protein